MATFKITTTNGFRALAADSEGRNRGPTEACLKALDSEGIHVAGIRMLHNDAEWRTQWCVKLIDVAEPAIIWMDNSFEAFDRHTFTHRS